jgi:D-threo-aldose 1-dehydrogenase
MDRVESTHWGKSRVGRTPLEISRLGLGGGPLGFIYQPVSDEVARATVWKALDVGVDHLDTAPLYGVGESERRIGEALTGKGRNSFTISTKVGRVLVPRQPTSKELARWPDRPHMDAVFDFSGLGIAKSFRSSLKRLQLDRVDIVFIHDCDDHIEQALTESHPAVSRLKKEGLTRAIGAGLNSYETALKLARAADFDCFLLAGRYTLLEQGALDEFLPYCKENRIGVLIGGPFNSGILASADLSQNSKYNYADAPPQVLDRARRAKSVCDKYGVPLRAAALQFILANPVVTAIIPGCRSPSEVVQNVEAVEMQIPGGVWDELKGEGLIREDAPTPG